MFSAIKIVHVSCAVLSFSGFLIRGMWMMRGSPWLKNPWVRVAPHVIDTTLLVSAIFLAIGIRQYPLTHGWLTAKVVALILYIGLGFVALRFGKTRRIRIGAWLAALGVFLYIVGVALTHSATLSPV